MEMYEGVTLKFPDWVDNEICAYNNKYSSRSNTNGYMAAKLTRLTHKMAIQLQPVAESCTICISRSRRPVRKLLDTPSYCKRYLIKSKNCNNATRCSYEDWATWRPLISARHTETVRRHGPIQSHRNASYFISMLSNDKKGKVVSVF
jgi:hypothetical protein